MHVHLLYQRLYELETIMVLKNFTTEVKLKRIWQLGTRHPGGDFYIKVTGVIVVPFRG